VVDFNASVGLIKALHLQLVITAHGGLQGADRIRQRAVLRQVVGEAGALAVTTSLQLHWLTAVAARHSQLGTAN
jgi:hypothetical protein